MNQGRKPCQVAERLASAVGGDLYEIVPAEPYSDADLNWNDKRSRSTKEQNDKSARPAIAGETLDLSGYTTIYAGYPIWWGEEPRASAWSRISSSFLLFSVDPVY